MALRHAICPRDGYCTRSISSAHASLSLSCSSGGRCKADATRSGVNEGRPRRRHASGVAQGPVNPFHLRTSTLCSRSWRARWQSLGSATSADSTALGVVVTGGTRGLGFALAQEFARLGHSVVLTGRDEAAVDAAIAAIRRSAGPGAGTVSGMRCDVSCAKDVAALGLFSQDQLGLVHRWLNNAGEVTRKRLLPDIPVQELERVVGSNVLGSLLGCREAIQLMRSQPGSAQLVYHIFNYGFSSWGAGFSRSACTHKATKTALTELTRALAEELMEAGITSIGVHNLSPGMVLTDLLLCDASPIAKRVFNALAEEPETVAAELVPRVCRVQGTGTSIECLSPVTAAVRMAASLPQIISGDGRWFTKHGSRVGSEQYNKHGTRVQFEGQGEQHGGR